MSDMLDFYTDERFLQSSSAHLTIRADDPKATHLKEDVKLEIEGQPYYITEIERSREAERALVEVTCEAGWMRLADIKRVGTTLLTGVSVSVGLTAILADTGWTAVQVSDQPGAYSIEATDASVLSLVWQWAKITGNEVLFESGSRVITMLPQVGANRGLAFRYGRNLKSIKQTVTPPLATRVFAFGRNDLDLTSVTGGYTYIEDYSYYTDQGMSLDDAKLYYRKDDVIQDDSFIDADALLEAATARLAILSQPQVMYEMSILDLSRLTGFREDDFGLGDTVYVYDDVLGINVQARVSRILRYPYEPQRNQVELTSGPIIINDQNTRSARSSTTQSWELFTSQNITTPRQIRDFSTILHRIKLRTIADAEWVFGYSLKGVAVGNSTITISCTEDNAATSFWPEKEITLVDGEIFEYNFTFGQKEIPSGEYIFVIRGDGDTVGAGLNIEPMATAFWILARGSTRENVTLPTSVRYDYTGGLQTFLVPDDVTEVLIEAHGSRGARASAGKGAMVKGNFSVTAGNTLDVLVGGHTSFSGGGYPDGGSGGAVFGSEVTGAGGSSQVRPQGGALATALLVAAGGGGAGDGAPGGSTDAIKGGDGGFYEGTEPGYGSASINHDLRATQSAPGLAGYGPTYGPSGGWLQIGEAGDTDGVGQGGDCPTTPNFFAFDGGGGGGGWHGGGAASSGQAAGLYGGGGGGGSGWFSFTYGWDMEIEDGENDGQGYIIISWTDPGGE